MSLGKYLLGCLLIFAVGTSGFAQADPKNTRDKLVLNILLRFADNVAEGEPMYILRRDAPSQKTVKALEKHSGVRVILTDAIVGGRTTYWFQDVTLKRKTGKAVLVRHWAGLGESFRVTYFFNCSRKQTTWSCKLTKVSRSQS